MATQFSVSDNRPWKARFFVLWGGQAFSLVGSLLVQFALIWYLTVETSSATVLATASLVGLLPQVVLGPVVGTLVDRWDRRRIMLLSDSLIAFATLLLAGLFALGDVALWHIYALMFIRSLAGSFHVHAMSASTSLMVPVEHLTRIQGVNQMLQGGLNVISAPLGALLLGLLPIQGILFLDIGTALFAIAPLLFVSIPQPERTDRRRSGENEPGTLWQDLKAGVQYMLGWPGLLIIGVMAVLINLVLTPAFSLVPLLVKDHFGGGALQLGWVESAIGIGVIAGGALLGIWGGFKRKILTSMMGLIGLGVGTVVVGVAPSSALNLAAGGALIMGLMMPIINGPIFAVVQSAVEPAMQARILSLLISLSGGMAPLGLMVAGPVADRFGIQVWFLAGGLVCVGMAVAGVFVPAVMNIEADREVTGRSTATRLPDLVA